MARKEYPGFKGPDAFNVEPLAPTLAGDRKRQRRKAELRWELDHASHDLENASLTLDKAIKLLAQVIRRQRAAGRRVAKARALWEAV